MFNRRSVTRKRRLFPQSWGGKVGNFAYFAFGIALTILCVAALAAIVSYDSGDPSWQVASESVPRNWMGLAGSYFAGSFRLALGWVSPLPIILCLSWSILMIGGRFSARIWLRIGAFITAPLVLAPCVTLALHVFAAPPLLVEQAAGWIGTDFALIVTRFALWSVESNSILASIPWVGVVILGSLWLCLVYIFGSLMLISMSISRQRYLSVRDKGLSFITKAVKNIALFVLNVLLTILFALRQGVTRLGVLLQSFGKSEENTTSAAMPQLHRASGQPGQHGQSGQSGQSIPSIFRDQRDQRQQHSQDQRAAAVRAPLNAFRVSGDADNMDQAHAQDSHAQDDGDGFISGDSAADARLVAEEPFAEKASGEISGEVPGDLPPAFTDDIRAGFFGDPQEVNDSLDGDLSEDADDNVEDFAEYEDEFFNDEGEDLAPQAPQASQASGERGDGVAYSLPALDLLELDGQGEGEDGRSSFDAQVLRRMGEQLLHVLREFKVLGEIQTIRPGPVVTLFEFEPRAGTKISRIVSLSEDIARSMSATTVRIASQPGSNLIGIELPNEVRRVVGLRGLLKSAAFKDSSAHLPVILGRDIGGKPIVSDLARMPHLLVAGTTGSGKSVCMNTLILSLLFRMTPQQCRLILIDPKMLELSVYNDIPHLLTPVVTDSRQAVTALKWAVREMENRYRLMSQLGVRNIDGYNRKLSEANRLGKQLSRRIQTGFDPSTRHPIYEVVEVSGSPMPFIVLVVDEMADLMMTRGKEIEAQVQRLAQMARAAGIHLIMATQRPSVDVITGTIKANFPTRISFQVTSKIDSRTILGDMGAEALLGKGDMLFQSAGSRIVRVHGPYCSEDEVENVCKFWRSQGIPEYLEEVITETSDEASSTLNAAVIGDGVSNDDEDERYQEAVDVVQRENRVSTSFIQRHLSIGYNRAARIVDAMEKNGLVSKADRVGRRELINRAD